MSSQRMINCKDVIERQKMNFAHAKRKRVFDIVTFVYPSNCLPHRPASPTVRAVEVLFYRAEMGTGHATRGKFATRGTYRILWS